jgi:hypothetical protein
MIQLYEKNNARNALHLEPVPALTFFPTKKSSILMEPTDIVTIGMKSAKNDSSSPRGKVVVEVSWFGVLWDAMACHHW